MRLAGTETVALSVPGVKLDDGSVYTVFAMGLAGGEPALVAVPSVDSTHASAAAPTTLPTTGGESALLLALLAGAALLMMGGGVRMAAKRNR